MMGIDEYWNRFKNGFTAQDDTKEYIFSMRLAFFTGALSVMTIAIEAAKAGTPEDANTIMKSAYDEIKAASDSMLVEIVGIANPLGEN